MSVGPVPQPRKGTIPVTDVELATAAAAVGFQGTGLVNAVAVALAEHGGKPTLDAVSMTRDLGPWQINWHAHVLHGEHFDSDRLLSDLNYNAQAAHSIWLDRDATFLPWSTFRAGLHLLYKDRARKAIEAGPGFVQGDTGGNVATSIDDFFRNGAGQIFGKLLDVHTWVRVGAVIGGAILLFVALRFFVSEIAFPAVKAVAG